MRKPCPCCGGVPGGFGGTLVVNSQPADLQAENARLRELLAEERAEAAVVQAWGESEAQSKVELFFMLSQHRAARAAHRSAAQQEGQDGE